MLVVALPQVLVLAPSIANSNSVWSGHEEFSSQNNDGDDLQAEAQSYFVFFFLHLIVSLFKGKMGGPDGKGDYATVEKNEKKVFLKMNEQFPHKDNFDDFVKRQAVKLTISSTD